MKIIEEFGINPILLLAQIVNFTILLLLLRKFLYGPILKVLDERKAKVARSIKQAEEIENRLEKTTLEQEQILDKARVEAAKIINESKEEARALSEKNMAETKRNVEEMLAKTEKRLASEREAMMQDVKKDIGELVMAATVKVTRKVIDNQENKDLVEETIKEIER